MPKEPKQNIGSARALAFEATHRAAALRDDMGAAEHIHVSLSLASLKHTSGTFDRFGAA